MFQGFRFFKIKNRKLQVVLILVLSLGFIFYGIQSSAFRPTIAFWKGSVSVALLEFVAGQLGGTGSVDGTGASARFNEPYSGVVDSSGNLFITDRLNHTIRKITPAGVVTTFAGSPGATGTTDGTGTAARFFQPAGIAINSSDELFVVDKTASTIRKITSAGVVTTFAGAPPGNDGTGPTVRFNYPTGVTFDSSGNLYVADVIDSLIRKITPSLVTTTFAGSVGLFGYVDGTGSAARFNVPLSVVADSSGNLFVADVDNFVIRKITPAGVVTTFAGLAGSAGTVDGTGSAARFVSITALAIDSSDNLYATEYRSTSNNDTALIRKITPTAVVTTIAGAVDAQDGTGAEASFALPSDTATDSAGNIFVADTENYSIRKITPAGVVTTFAGSAEIQGNVDDTGTAARFFAPVGIAIDSTDNLYVSDENAHVIRKITSAGVVTTFAGLSGNLGTDDGTGSAARFFGPTGLSIDSSGDLFVADLGNNTIRKVTSAGVVTTLAGLAGSSGSADGTGSAARFYGPRDVTVGTSGNLFVSDYYNHTIRMVTPGGVVTTLAGLAGSQGSSNGTSSAARFRYPTSLVSNTSGDLFVSDSANYTIRKVTSGGVVTTFAGVAGSSGVSDGTSSAARFHTPIGISINNSGDLYLAEYINDTIRKINSAGTVTTIAGALDWADGTGAAARFREPRGIAVSTSGDLFIGDYANQVVRKITPAGVVTTFAGSGGEVGSTNGTGSAARFCGPTGIVVDGVGNLFLSDRCNELIRKITAAGAVTTLAGAVATGYVDGSGAAARFSSPDGISMNASGELIIADSGNSAIRKVTSAGDVTTLIGIPSGLDGTGLAARFNDPTGIAVNSSGELLVADTGSATIRKVTAAGVVTTLAGLRKTPGTSNGTGSAASFYSPYGIAVNAAGDTFVSEVDLNTIRKITPAGVVTTYAGVTWASGSSDGTSSAASFSHPEGLAVNTSGELYIADRYNNTIRKIDTGGTVSTFAGSAGQWDYLDAVGTAAKFRNPTGIAFNTSGDMYVADLQNHVVRKINSAAVVTTFAGSPSGTGTTDGVGTSAAFNNPNGFVINASGDIYVADSNNYTIRKVTSAGAVSTFAGSAGNWGSIDDSGTAAQFGTVNDIAIDSLGNLFVTDADQNTIRKITPAGDVATFAGTVGLTGSADGTGTSASFNYPESLAVDSADNIFVGDSINNTIRKITPAGVVTTFAGLAGAWGSADGTGSTARFNYPTGIAIDSSDNLYVADSNNVTIRKITPAGVVTTLAGQVSSYGSVDGTGSAARFSYFTRLTIDGSGNLFVADSYNNTIRKVTTPAGVATTVVGDVSAVGNRTGPMPGNLSFPIDVAVRGSQMYILTKEGGAILKCPKP